MKKILKEVLKLSITVLLFYLLFKKISIGEVLNTVKGSDYFLLTIGFSLFYLYYLFFAIRWHYLLKYADVNITLGRAYSYLIISFFFNNFLPSAVGQDAVRSAYVGGKEEFSKCLGVALVDRLVGFIGMLAIGIFALFGRGEKVKILALVYLLLVLLLIVLYLLFTGKGRFTSLKNRVLKVKFLNIGEEIRTLFNAFRGYREKPIVILKSVFLSVVVQGVITGINFSIARAISMDVSFFTLLIFLPIITVVSLIPLTINGLGLREMAYVYLFGLVTIKGEDALSLSLVFYFLSVIASIPGGLLFLLMRRKS